MPLAQNRLALLQSLGLTPQALASKPSARLAFSSYAPGLPLGTPILLQGAGRTQAVARLLAEHPALPAVWVEERLSAYPPGLAQQGVRLERLLFIESGPQWAWTLATLLRSQVFKVVIAASPLQGPEVEAGLRRLQLAAERAQCLLLLLALPQGPAWALRHRFKVQGQGAGLHLQPQQREAVASGTGA